MTAGVACSPPRTGRDLRPARAGAAATRRGTVTRAATRPRRDIRSPARSNRVRIGAGASSTRWCWTSDRNEPLDGVAGARQAGRRARPKAEAFAFEFELECQLRAGASVERLDSEGPGWADGAVDASEGAPMRRIVLGDLVADIARADGEAAFVGRAAPDPCRPVGVDLHADDLVLPLAVLAQVGEIREDIFGAAVDLDAVDDRCHHFSSRLSVALFMPARRR